MQIDATVNLGQLLTAVGFLATLVSGWYSIRNQVVVAEMKISGLSNKVDSIAQEMKVQTEILVRLGQQETEIRELRSRVDRMHGSHVN